MYCFTTSISHGVEKNFPRLWGTGISDAIFGDIFTLSADYIAWKLLKMALEVEYMMEYQHPGLPVTEDCWLQRRSADSTVMDRKKAVLSF